MRSLSERADRGYAGLDGWLLALCNWVLQVIKRPKATSRFTLLPRRWVVECTFAWLGRYRRLSKDHETLPTSSKAWIYIAMCCLMLKRLANL
ncbi:MAG TPA: transposase [Aggregatilineales bacterium]|nr:transposase [Aggregatilineales bacterium]